MVDEKKWRDTFWVHNYNLLITTHSWCIIKSVKGFCGRNPSCITWIKPLAVENWTCQWDRVSANHLFLKLWTIFEKENGQMNMKIPNKMLC